MIPAPVPPVVIPRHTAEQQLYGAYNNWKKGNIAVKNSPHGCSNISRDTFNYLRNKWPTTSVQGKTLGPNSSRQAASHVTANAENIKRWVSESVTGAGGTVDFHALWSVNTHIGFLHHFRIV